VGILGVLRRLAPVAITVGAFAAATSSAEAATRVNAQAMRGAMRMFDRSLPAALRTTLLPQTLTPVAANTALELDTRPMPLAVNGVVYQMAMSAFTVTDQFGLPPQLQIGLSRVSMTSGRITGEQFHAYGFSSTGMTMTASQGLANLHVDTNASFSPTEVDSIFTPVATSSQKCTLYTGGQGTSTRAVGSLASTTFRVATGTSPFFGTITTAPTSASAFADPGCISGGGSIGGSSASHTFYFPCSGRETIQAGSLFGATSWAAGVGFGGQNAYLFTQTGSTSTTTTVAHFAFGVESASDMPLPRHSAGGATATLGTAGNPLFGGASFFFSHHAPVVSPIRTCAYGGHLHHFVATRYVGGMSPVTTSPLAALFDTGTLDYHGQAASLVIRRYLS
jgi:hypothetical protein